MEIETLVITGLATDCCVECTGRDAADRGYNVIVVEDAVATFVEKHHFASLSGMGLVYTQIWNSTQVMEAMQQTFED